MQKTVAFYTLGCKVNQYETNAIAQKFIEKGYKKVEFDEQADIYIINTCTVTNMADKKSRQIIRQAKLHNKNAIVVATGCYAEVSRTDLEKIEELDIIVGNKDKSNIVEIVEKQLNQESDINEEKEFQDFGTVTYTEKTRAVIKVQDGCNNFCTYCIIPYAKGRVRSRKPESVIKEVQEIVKSGIKEVVITGIHVASYGKDFEDGIRLIDLLEKINRIEGLKRIRLGSLEPNLITEEFVRRLKDNVDKICDHFHLSLQSGCNETLKRMNRRYTTEEFEKGVNLLRNAFPNVALTTDIIVGFPSETEEEFETTYKFLEKIKFSKMHIFKYSPRKGTVAAKMANQISPGKKEERSNKLIELSDKNEEEFLNKYIGKTLEVLFEATTDNEYIEGHTSNYIMVKVKGENLENTIQKVNIKECNNLTLIGDLI